MGSASEAMRKTLEVARTAARSGITILLTGESGSGKDYLAQYIHDNSMWASGPFFSLNCAAISHELAESELFGHEAGAFTGAARSKKGLLELAEGGTILLNEIGELSLWLQAKLLTFMDTKSFVKVGGEKSMRANARLIAATNRDLAKEIEAGRFREDLFHRLNVVRIHVPPLRDRIEDIPSLVQEILEMLRTELQIHALPAVTPETMAEMQAYHWPGNVRELRNVLERALILTPGPLLKCDLPKVEPAPAEGPSYSIQLREGLSLNDQVREFKRFAVEAALGLNGGRIAKAAKALGISRFSVRNHLKERGNC